MSKQDVFNKSVLHVLKQGKPSGQFIQDKDCPRFQCEYRAADGSQCAAGPFIVNYSPDMENKTFRRLAEGYASNLEPDAREHSWLVAALQDAHDGAAQDEVNAGVTQINGEPVFLNSFKEAVREIARQHQLELPAGV
jgi:hypothetical protein